MPLTTGTRLGPYEIVAPLGAGGMGEVYRAADTRLGRDVALKVLPDLFARDPERIARFAREAQLLAALNHPHIGSIYGFEEAAGARCLVLELVEGPTLADRLAGPAGSPLPIPVDEALDIAKQIAEALEAAHDKGIIHRDLKPANVKITPEGTVKVLDFGLAKALADDLAAADPSTSPTITAAGTRAGTILGTAAYMSPEQARGKAADRRTDIWAFGCVLFELLAGKRAFDGDTSIDILARVVQHEPALDSLPASTPPRIVDLLRRCLQKDPKRRLRDIGDARLEIEEALVRTPLPWHGGEGVSAPEPRLHGRQIVPWAISALLLVAVAAIAIRWPPRPAAIPVRRVVIPVGSSLAPDVNTTLALAMSPDGRTIAYVAANGDSRSLYVRRLDSFDPAPIRDTDGASSPFFSPDGAWVGFFAAGKLKKVPVRGGAPQIICDAENGRGAAWAPDDTIVFAPTLNTTLWRVSAAGGPPQPLTTLDADKGEVSHRWPALLPGGKAILFTVKTAEIDSFDDARIVARSLVTGEQRTVLEGGMSAQYVPTGHLIYGRAGKLFAAPFDVERRSVTGPAIPVLDGPATLPTSGAAQFAVSTDGSLVYVAGGSLNPSRQLVWVDRHGTARAISDAARPYIYIRLSPDGRRVITSYRAANNKIWLYDLTRGTLTRLTFGPGNDQFPIWTPDGTRIVFGSERQGGISIFSVPADRSGPEQILFKDDRSANPTSWSPDGKTLVFNRNDAKTASDIWSLSTDGDRQSTPLVRSAFEEANGMLSPDGRWLAYQSNESGRFEIYVQGYPGAGGRWQISTDGGTDPVWARSGRELFYRRGGRIMTVAVRTHPVFGAGTPQFLFEWPIASFSFGYDVSPDGERFLMLQPEPSAIDLTHLNLVLNWFDELKRMVSAGSN